MRVEHIAAFSTSGIGGNPAGVALCEILPEVDEMQRIAREIGYSETVFAAPMGKAWRVRYFSPAMEVPFCRHATIALGAILARSRGEGIFSLQLNDTAITVEGHAGTTLGAALQSPPTRSEPCPEDLLTTALHLSRSSRAISTIIYHRQSSRPVRGTSYWLSPAVIILPR